MQSLKLSKNKPIANVFFESFHTLNNALNYSSVKKTDTTFQVGFSKNFKQYTQEEVDKCPGVVKVNEIREFHHMHLFVPKQFVDTSDKSIEAIMAPYRDSKEVLKRAITEIPLATAIRNLRGIIKKEVQVEDDLSFLDQPIKANTTNQLRFEILKDVYLTKKAERDAAAEAIERRERNQRIMELIKNKQDKELEGKSIEELQAMLNQ